MNRIRWLINRVRVMSVPEVMFRIHRSVMQRLEHLRVMAGWKPQLEVAVKTGVPLFGEDANLCVEWNACFQLDPSRLDEYLAGRLNLFGHEPLDIGNPVVWHRDPVTGTEAPRAFGKTLNYRENHIVGNVKFTWELGRHQHLVPLAVAYAVSGDVRYRQAVVDQIEGWIEQNPFGIGIHWCTSLEASLRLISWAVVHSLLVLKDGESGLFAAVKDSQRLGESIYQQAYFVRHFLSRYSSANNHLIGELSGLWVSCQVFDLGDKGREWSVFVHQELEREARKQVHTDGVDKEQAFYYHLWVLEYLLFVWMAGTRSGRDFSEAFLQRIQAMAHFLRDVSPDRGEPPQIGDADDGFVARFEPDWPEMPYRELLDAVDYVFGGTGVAVNQKAFWYRAMVPADVGARPESGWHRSYPAVYPQGGYVVLGGAGFHVVFDAGPLGYLGIAAHGHADALSFCLAVDGEWWLVDPGTYAYHSDPEWRSYFRGTAAHNTIRVNQENQSQISGPFMWGRKAGAWIENLEEVSGIQIVTACHDGYRHLGLTHSRTLRFSPADAQLELVDALRGAGRRTELTEIYYHFAPGVDIAWTAAERCWIATREGRKKRLRIYTDSSWKYAVTRAGVNPISGWYSPALEEKVPTNALRGVAVAAASLRSNTRIVAE